MPKIILVGYMGSGKSTVARVLAAKTRLPAIDLDEKIEEKAGISVADFFSKYGELRFRQLERGVLRGILDSDSDAIVSTGGGAPCYFNNMPDMNEAGETVFLRASVPQLLENLKGDAQRPLLSGLLPDEKAGFIAKHLFERNPFYRMAMHTVSVDGKSPDAVADEILEKIGF